MSRAEVVEALLDLTERAMPERLWQCPDDLEAKLLPQVDGGSVGADDEVELHRAVAGLSCLLEAMLTHGAAGAFALHRGIDHERRVGDVRTQSAVIRDQLVHPDDAAVVFDQPVGFLGTPGAAAVFRQVPGPAWAMADPMSPTPRAPAMCATRKRRGPRRASTPTRSRSSRSGSRRASPMPAAPAHGARITIAAGS